MAYPEGPIEWVVARANWTVEKAFEALRENVRRDVWVRNTVREQPLRWKFHFSDSAGGGFAVFVEGSRRSGPGGAVPTVRFSYDDGNATIYAEEDSASDQALKGVVALVDGEPRIVVNGRAIPEWQFRQMALESLFFSNHDRRP